MSEPGLPLTKNLELFPDLHPALDPRSAVTEANRCLNCFDAPCMSACPTHIDVPGFIKRIASGNVQGSARVILQANDEFRTDLASGGYGIVQWEQKFNCTAFVSRYASSAQLRYFVRTFYRWHSPDGIAIGGILVSPGGIKRRPCARRGLHGKGSPLPRSAKRPFCHTDQR